MELTSIEDGSKPFEITGLRPIHSVSFIEDGTQVLSGGAEGMLRRWRVGDGYEVGQAIRAEGGRIFAAALSPDRKWIACGLRLLLTGSSNRNAEVQVWDTQTHKKALDLHDHTNTVFTVDFSPDSAKVATGSADKLAFVWSLATGQRLVGPLRHGGVVVTVRFSPNGDRIATAATGGSIRIYDSNSGDRLLEIPFSVNTHVSSSLAWAADSRQLFAIAYSKVKHFDTSSDSFTLLGEWPVPGGGSSASVILSHNQKFIVVVANQTLSFWDADTHEQIGVIFKHATSIWSISLSPNDHCIATGEENGKIISRCLRGIIPGAYIMVNSSLSASQLPLVYVNGAVFESWTRGDLTRAEELLTREIAYPIHRARALAQRALVRARLKQWNMAVIDAKESIEIKKSVIGYTANAIAHVGNGEHDLAMPVFDLVFSIHVPTENRFLLLIKAVILFECGKYGEAILRVDNLISIVDDRSPYLNVQARMFLICGDKSLRNGDSERALEFFKRAGAARLADNHPQLVVISLMFGWNFDQLDEEIQLHLQECILPFEGSGDAAMESRNLEEAINQFSIALSLKPTSPAGLLIKRSEARAMLRLWEGALGDADQAIHADPLSPCGHKRRYAALHGLQRFDDAIHAFKHMLSLIEQSPDHEIRRLREKYFSPSQLEPTIEGIVREVFKQRPLVLIDVENGRLCDAVERLNIFKSKSQFKELVSSMTEVLDDKHVREVVKGYFQYVMLSHVWAGKEPSFQDVNAKSVWELDSSPLNQKLKMFCKTVQKNGYQWAWSDTCCIDKTNSTVLNQSLTEMYKWYEASAATFVLLADVDTPSALGDLANSGWMTRAWTAQELLAPKVVRFHDCNWRPYLDDTSSNHKDSSEIVQELVIATGVVRKAIITFHPNDLSIREKLRLASNRSATVEEDVAYSLIGIFKSDIRPHYGEGDAALGHLLEEIVARSGDVTVLDWAGRSSTYNSCLPATLKVYGQLPCPPPTIEVTEMNARVAVLRSSLPRAEAMLVHDRVVRLPPARFANRRLYLPCIVFAVKKLQELEFGSGREYYYRARVTGIGNVDLKTLNGLSVTEARKFVLVHPWIRDLRDPLDGVPWGNAGDSDASESDPETEAESASDSSLNDYTRALRLVVRLRQPFHALLLQQEPHGEFRRIAAENEIVVPGLDPRINLARDIRIQTVEIL